MRFYEVRVLVRVPDDVTPKDVEAAVEVAIAARQWPGGWRVRPSVRVTKVAAPFKGSRG